MGETSASTKAPNKMTLNSNENTHHFWSEAETAAYVDWINLQLADHSDLSGILPISKQGTALFEACHDGILLAKLVNSSVEGTVDEKSLTRNCKIPIHKSQNLIKVLDGCRAIGVQVHNIGPEDIMRATPHLCLGIVWQIIKFGLLANVELSGSMEICNFGSVDSVNSDSSKPSAPLSHSRSKSTRVYSSEKALLTWLNYCVEKTGYTGRVTNFGNDLSDSMVLAHLVSYLTPAENEVLSVDSVQAEEDLLNRAEMVLAAADSFGCRQFASPTDIVEGSKNLNMAFVAVLYNNRAAATEAEIKARKLELELQNLEKLASEKLESEREKAKQNNDLLERDFKEKLENSEQVKKSIEYTNAQLHTKIDELLVKISILETESSTTRQTLEISLKSEHDTRELLQAANNEVAFTKNQLSAIEMKSHDNLRNLQEKLNYVSDELETAKESSFNASEESKELAAEIEVLRADYLLKQEESSKLVKELESQLAIAREENNNLKNELGESKKENEDKNEEIQNLQKRLADAEKEFGEKAENLAELRKEKSELENQLDELSEKLNSSQQTSFEESEKLRNALEITKARVSEIEKECDDIKTESGNKLDSVLHDLSILETKLSEANSDLGQQNKTHQNAVEVLTNEMRSLENYYAEKEIAFKEQLNNAIKDVESACKVAKEAKDHEEKALETLHQLEKEIETFKACVPADSNEEITTRSASCSPSENLDRFKDILDRLELQTQARKDASEVAAKESEERAKLQEELLEATNRLASLVPEVKELREKIENFEKETNSGTAQHSELVKASQNVVNNTQVTHHLVQNVHNVHNHHSVHNVQNVQNVLNVHNVHNLPSTSVHNVVHSHTVVNNVHNVKNVLHINNVQVQYAESSVKHTEMISDTRPLQLEYNVSTEPIQCESENQVVADREITAPESAEDYERRYNQLVVDYHWLISHHSEKPEADIISKIKDQIENMKEYTTRTNVHTETHTNVEVFKTVEINSGLEEKDTEDILEELQDKVAELETLKKEKDDAIESAQIERDVSSKLQKQLSHANSKLSTLTSDLDIVVQRSNSSVVPFKEVSRQQSLANAFSSLKEVKSKLELLESTPSKPENEQFFMDEITKLREKLHETTTTVWELSSLVHNLSVQDQINELTKSLSDRDYEISDLKKEIFEMNNDKRNLLVQNEKAVERELSKICSLPSESRFASHAEAEPVEEVERGVSHYSSGPRQKKFQKANSQFPETEFERAASQYSSGPRNVIAKNPSQFYDANNGAQSQYSAVQRQASKPAELVKKGTQYFEAPITSNNSEAPPNRVLERENSRAQQPVEAHHSSHSTGKFVHTHTTLENVHNIQTNTHSEITKVVYVHSKEELNKVRHNLEVALAQADHLKAELSTLQSSSHQYEDELLEEIARLQKQLRETDTKIWELNQIINNLAVQDQINLLSRLVSEREAQIDDLKNDISCLIDQNESVTNREVAQETKLEEEKSIVEKQFSNVEQLIEKELRTTITSTEQTRHFVITGQELKDREALLTKLQAVINLMKEYHVQRNLALESAKVEHQDNVQLQKLLNAANQRISDLNEELSQVKNRLIRKEPSALPDLAEFENILASEMDNLTKKEITVNVTETTKTVVVEGEGMNPEVYVNRDVEISGDLDQILQQLRTRILELEAEVQLLNGTEHAPALSLKDKLKASSAKLLELEEKFSNEQPSSSELENLKKLLQIKTQENKQQSLARLVATEVAGEERMKRLASEQKASDLLTEIKVLKDCLSELDQEKLDLQQKLIRSEELRAELNEENLYLTKLSNDEIAEKDARIKGLKEKMEQAEITVVRKITTMEHVISSESNKHKNLLRQMSVAEQNAKGVDNELESLKERCENISKEREELSEKVLELEKEIEEIKGEGGKKVIIEKEKLTEKEATIYNLTIKIDALRKQNTDNNLLAINSDEATVQQKLNETELKLSEAIGEIETLNNRLEQLIKEKDEIIDAFKHNKLKALDQKQKSDVNFWKAEDGLKEKETKLANAEEKLEKLEEQLAQSIFESAKLEEEHNQQNLAQNEELAILRCRTEDQKAEIESLREAIKHLAIDNKRLANRNSSIEKAEKCIRAEAEAQLKRSLDDIAGRDEQIRSMKERLDAASRVEIARKIAVEAAAMESYDNAQLREKLLQAVQQAEDADEIARELTEKIKKSEEQSEFLKEKLNELEEESTALKRDNYNLLKSSLNSLEDKDKQINNMEDKVKDLAIQNKARQKAIETAATEQIERIKLQNQLDSTLRKYEEAARLAEFLNLEISKIKSGEEMAELQEEYCHKREKDHEKNSLQMNKNSSKSKESVATSSNKNLAGSTKSLDVKKSKSRQGSAAPNTSSRSIAK
ncbi:Plastin-3 [Clydaea vesicula]|uniref:Plastin-3 n=1 Tax=Clydaea vesicula TaxID=447962 RepID=A0AAD5U5D4_9FUNG|nr:Plastin-3 [Clydaea vesicula]